MQPRKFLRRIIAGALLTMGLAITLAASINNNQPVPVTWSNGTNSFGLDADAMPTITRLGTNYSGISTNFALTNGATVTVKGGIIVSIQ